jgi:ferredoxin/flavodoxin---NADP+ reductase
MSAVFDLVVVGGSPTGLSVVVQARRAGLENLLILRLPQYDVPGLSKSIGRLPIQEVASVDVVEGKAHEPLRLETDRGPISAQACVLDLPAIQDPSVPFEIPDSIADRVHTGADFDAEEADVLVVGEGDMAALTTLSLSKGGARVCLALAGTQEELSLVSAQLLANLERDQRVTILWLSKLQALWEQGGYPMVGFTDRMTPDLQFDHVVFVNTVADTSTLPIRIEPDSDLRLFVLGTPDHALDGAVAVPAANAWETIRSRRFPHLAPLAPRATTSLGQNEIRELEKGHYNATITEFDTAHNELWRIRIKPDRETITHRAGQYCSVGLGYWEPRADDSSDPGIEKKQHRLVRRSYSISSSIFDGNDYLVDHAEMDEIELYIVWVTPDEGRTPALTPRLALKNPGDRLYLGPKVAGRYTINAIEDPSSSIVFCATGTGEAPHNAMVVELLRKGHYGPILSVVTVRYLTDLAYLDEHHRLEERFPNYQYLPVPTREPDVEKRYIQDLIEDGTLDESLGRAPEPEETHFFLCGNPNMIGLPEWTEYGPKFPTTVGVAQLLHDRGFVLDRRGRPGNIHYEEYW